MKKESNSQVQQVMSNIFPHLATIVGSTKSEIFEKNYLSKISSNAQVFVQHLPFIT